MTGVLAFVLLFAYEGKISLTPPSVVSHGSVGRQASRIWSTAFGAERMIRFTTYGRPHDTRI